MENILLDLRISVSEVLELSKNTGWENSEKVNGVDIISETIDCDKSSIRRNRSGSSLSDIRSLGLDRFDSVSAEEEKEAILVKVKEGDVAGAGDNEELAIHVRKDVNDITLNNLRGIKFSKSWGLLVKLVDDSD